MLVDVLLKLLQFALLDKGFEVGVFHCWDGSGGGLWWYLLWVIVFGFLFIFSNAFLHLYFLIDDNWF